MRDHTACGKMIAAFARSMFSRPDRSRCCAVLADALIEHRNELWPEGGQESTPEWIADHVPSILVHLANVIRVAGIIIADEDSADNFLLKMAWLPTLIQDLDARHGRLDA